MDLDILGQQPCLSNLFTQLAFFFRVPNDTNRQQLANRIAFGLECLSNSFPWIAGQVVHEALDHDPRGVYKVVPFRKSPSFVILESFENDELPAMDELRRSSFPMALLDEKIIAPINTIAAGTPAVADVSPVMMAQANFISGGLILTFVTQHNVMDMTGMGQILSLLSKACHGVPFTEEEVLIGNKGRRSLISMLDESYKPGPELAYQIKRPAVEVADNTSHESVSPPVSCSWTYFNFSSGALSALKKSATESLPSEVSFVSTDDVLTSFLWQSILRARQSRIASTTTRKTTLMRAVDPRRYLDIPETYPGLVQNMVYHTHTIDELTRQSLGAVAGELRQAVDPMTSSIGFSTRALVTHYHRASDRGGINVTANYNPETDLMLSSWSKVQCCDLDFNLGLGLPECVRRPSFVPVEGLLYLMPKSLDGSVAAGLCLRNDDIARLRHDDLFCEYAVYVG